MTSITRKEMWAGRRFPPAHIASSLLDRGYSDRLRTLGALFDLELNALVLLERTKATPLNFRVVDEHICFAAVGGDEAEALIAVEPFHSSLCHTFSTSLILNGCRKASCGRLARATAPADVGSVAQNFRMRYNAFVRGLCAPLRQFARPASVQHHEVYSRW